MAVPPYLCSFSDYGACSNTSASPDVNIFPDDSVRVESYILTNFCPVAYDCRRVDVCFFQCSGMKERNHLSEGKSRIFDPK